MTELTHSNYSPLVISIVGVSYSGKTALANTIVKRFNIEQVSVIAEDAYYKSQAHMTMDDRVKKNYDHLSAFDHELLMEYIACNAVRQLKCLRIVSLSILAKLKRKL